MSVNACISSCAGQILVFPVRNVLVCSGITKPLGEAEINGIHQVALFAKAHQKVVWLDVAMQEVFALDIFYAADLKLYSILIIRKKWAAINSRTI